MIQTTGEILLKDGEVLKVTSEQSMFTLATSEVVSKILTELDNTFQDWKEITIICSKKAL